MQLVHLEVFLAVVDSRNLSEAARRLRISASRVTERLQELERELQVTLVGRSTRELTLTAAGESLEPRARAIFRELDLIRVLFPTHQTQEIVVGVRSIPRDFRESFLKVLKVGAGGAEVSILPLDSATQIERLMTGSLDCGVVWDIPPSPLRHHLILIEEFGVAVPATHRFRKLDFVQPSDLAGLKLASVVNPSKTPTDSKTYLEYTPHVDIVNSTVADAVYLLVAGGRHCSIVPLNSTQHAALAEETRRNILVLPFADGGPHLRSYFVWRESPAPNPKLDTLIRYVVGRYPQPEVR